MGRGKLPRALERPHLRLQRQRRRGVRAAIAAFPSTLSLHAHEIHTVRLHIVLPGFYPDDEIVGLALRGRVPRAPHIVDLTAPHVYIYVYVLLLQTYVHIYYMYNIYIYIYIYSYMYINVMYL